MIFMLGVPAIWIILIVCNVLAITIYQKQAIYARQLSEAIHTITQAGKDQGDFLKMTNFQRDIFNICPLD